MHIYTLIFTILVTLCCINFVFAGPNGIDCQCVCCVPRPNAYCSPLELGYIHLNLTWCDPNKCLSDCKALYNFCEGANGQMHTTCYTRGLVAAAAQVTNNTTRTTTSTSTSTTTSVTTSTTTSETSAALTRVTLVSSITTEFTESSESTSSTTSENRNSTVRSSAGAIKSIFQLSHFILFTFSLTFFYF